MGLFGAAPKNPSHISYNDETWHSYTLPKKDPKKYTNHVTETLSSADIRIFHQKSAIFVISTNCLILNETLKIVLIKMVAILMVAAQLATLGLLKIKVS